MARWPDVVLLSHAANPERRTIDREEFAETLELLRTDLSLIERQCLLAVALDGLSYEQIADALKIDEKAIDNALQRARHKLAARWAPPACSVCGTVLDAGNRCTACERDLDFARRFIAG
jgi:DNA-directed RNA polymerase specialized sigma24 family protein